MKPGEDLLVIVDYMCMYYILTITLSIHALYCYDVVPFD